MSISISPLVLPAVVFAVSLGFVLPPRRRVHVPAVDPRHEVDSALDPRMMVDHAALREGGVARPRTGIARGHPDQRLTGRDDVGEILGVDLGARVVSGRTDGDDVIDVSRQPD